ncbi:polyhydroxybutyrate depolymerase [Bowmanella sp. Y26]|uniref:extracellular catalytic domain type 2 short-chain-length polyhydroxyalkanoate depolymerase n=1 Tax=Bowmanella yangjiangensis TaxID=2811230 RepID=UPI001BDD82B8|nr:PHB depolymerase family esterase [Bowmanella yangjiangensis]MBT1065232.1 polyhydroxybutyrate depolymerase [Bowmanella yangjiangensis]
MKTSLIRTLALSALTSSLAYAEVPKLNLDIQQITLSGLSSGGYMASQFHLAHSNWVSGVGVIAAGPYYCARNSILTALNQCVNKQEGAIPLEDIQAILDGWRSEALVDPAEGLKGDKVWLLRGTLDEKIIQPVADALAEQYQGWVGEAQVKYLSDKPFAHLFPTKEQGSECSTSKSPFIGNCGFDAASDMLSFISPDASEHSVDKPGNLISIDQQKLGGEHASGMADQAFLYVPANCAAGQSCQVHVSFHGCNQNIEAVGNDYARLTGINQWADKHNTVVLYPQTKQSTLMPLNPQACWDWWGYTNDKYATKQGPQIQAVEHMINALAGVN